MVPLEYMDRLHKLKNKKRPFCMRLNERSAVEFITQDVGYNELEETIVVKLDFGKEYLEISRDCYRTVSNWKCNTNKLKFD
jgi:hypothetical protein